MYLSYKDLAGIFPETRGVQDEMQFLNVTDYSKIPQAKGIFIPLSSISGELDEAIENGAIAAVWDKQSPLPRYTPNHFPLFLTDDLQEGTKKLLEYYVEKIDGETDMDMAITNFYFLTETLLNKNQQTYDIAGILKKLSGYTSTNDLKGGE